MSSRLGSVVLSGFIKFDSGFSECRSETNLDEFNITIGFGRIGRSLLANTKESHLSLHVLEVRRNIVATMPQHLFLG